MSGCHIKGDTSSGGVYVSMACSDFLIENCLFEIPATSLAGAPRDVNWINGGAGTVAADVSPVEPIIRFNTFIHQATGNTGADVLAQTADLRGVTWKWENNAYVIDPATVNTIDAGIAAIDDIPADFSASYNPLATANAYQSATGTGVSIPATDAEGTNRPASNVSRGALEP